MSGKLDGGKKWWSMVEQNDYYLKTCLLYVICMHKMYLMTALTCCSV